jgi:alcohol dehydrogenase class IV
MVAQSPGFDFSTADRILFGAGSVRSLPGLLRPWGQRFLVVTGRSAARVRPLVELLESEGLEPRLFSVPGEPTVDTVRLGCRLAAEQRVEGIVAFGGGSAIDAAKAISVLAANPGDVVEYLEIIGQGRALEKPGLPCAAVPTTAGTGTEVTRNAVLTSAEHRVKVSLRGRMLLPQLAIVDPELSYRLPPEPTATTGLDALTQLVEPFVSCRANPMTDALCREGMRRIARSLRDAHSTAVRLAEDPEALPGDDEKAARADLALAALFSGLALANAGLGAVHGFAGPIGGMFGAAHGAICAALLPAVTEGNVAVLKARHPEHPALARYREVATILCGDAHASVEEGIEWMRRITTDLGVAGLGPFGVTEADVDTVVTRATAASSMKGNPIALTREEMGTVLRAAL